MEKNNNNQATEFVDTLTRVEESFSKQVALAMLWAGGVYLALGVTTTAIWVMLVTVVISLPRFPTLRNMIKLKPYSRRSQILGVLTGAIWGIAPFMVWHAGQGMYDHLAVTMLGIGFLQVINQYRSEVRPAFIVAVPYLMLMGYFLYQSRMNTTFVIAVAISFAYLMTLSVFVWSGQKTKKSIVEYKLNQDKLKLDLETARDEAEQANQAKSVFLANMSHELRTPLNGILGLSDVLLNEPMEKGQHRKLSLIQDSGNNLMSILNDILDISKIEAGGITLEQIDVNLESLLQKSYAFWKPVADQKKISLSFQKQRELPTHIVADPTRICQCINNLINNALKFTPQNGQIVVKATGRQESGKYILFLSVQDTGIGISEENIGHLFTPFKQADEGTTRKFGGTGLGLAITRKLCRLMGGDLIVRSVLGTGSIFCMTITSEIANIETIEPISAVVAPTLVSELAGLRCLAVEDNDINLKVLLCMIEPYQLDVIVARDGKQAIDILESQYIDFVLMDLQMPVLGGLEATKFIRKSNKPYARVPIIAMTANAMMSDKTKCLDAGMNAYVSKPIGRSKLCEAILQSIAPQVKITKSVVKSVA